MIRKQTHGQRVSRDVGPGEIHCRHQTQASGLIESATLTRAPLGSKRRRRRRQQLGYPSCQSIAKGPRNRLRKARSPPGTVERGRLSFRLPAGLLTCSTYRRYNNTFTEDIDNQYLLYNPALRRLTHKSDDWKGAYGVSTELQRYTQGSGRRTSEEDGNDEHLYVLIAGSLGISSEIGDVDGQRGIVSNDWGCQREWGQNSCTRFPSAMNTESSHSPELRFDMNAQPSALPLKVLPCLKIGPPPVTAKAQIIIDKPMAGTRIALATNRYRIF